MRFLPECSTTSIRTWPGVESTRRKESTEANAVLEFDAVLELRADALRERPADLDQVGLGDLVGRVGQPVGQLAVVGQQQQALGGDVKAPDVEEPFALVVADVVADARPAFGVLHGGHHALGLVEHHVDQRVIELDAQAVHVDDGGLGIDAYTELGDDLAVDLNAALGDHLFADAAGGDAGGGHDLLQADAVGVVDFGLRHLGARDRGCGKAGGPAPRFWPKRSLPKARVPAALARGRDLGFSAPGVPGALFAPGFRASALRAPVLGAPVLAAGGLGAALPVTGGPPAGGCLVGIDEALLAGLGLVVRSPKGRSPPLGKSRCPAPEPAPRALGRACAASVALRTFTSGAVTW